jgi:hypothetical protein
MRLLILVLLLAGCATTPDEFGLDPVYGHIGPQGQRVANGTVFRP